MWSSKSNSLLCVFFFLVSTVKQNATVICHDWEACNTWHGKTNQSSRSIWWRRILRRQTYAIITTLLIATNSSACFYRRKNCWKEIVTKSHTLNCKTNKTKRATRILPHCAPAKSLSALRECWAETLLRGQQRAASHFQSKEIGKKQNFLECKTVWQSKNGEYGLRLHKFFFFKKKKNRSFWYPDTFHRDMTSPLPSTSFTSVCWNYYVLKKYELFRGEEE